jgi:hypothetical protein
MADIRTRLRQTFDDIVSPPDVMGSLATRRRRLARKRKEKRRKVAAAVVGVAVVTAGVAVFLREMSRPSTNPLADGNPIPQILDQGRLAPGPHLLSVAGLDITFTVPEGWRGSSQGVVDAELGADPFNGAGLSFWTVSNVYRDACHWRGSLADPPVGPTVNDLVASLATQHQHPSGDRVKYDVDGYDATELRLTVPQNIDLTTCSNGEFHSWQSPVGDRSHQGPGQIDQLFVLNVHGTRLVIDASYYPDTSKQDHSALFAMIRSVHFA